MEKAKQLFERYKERLKLIFIISVLVLIIAEIVVIGKNLSFSELGNIFTSIPSWRIVLMFVLGIVTVLPMINYDFILEKIIGEKFPRRYLIENSFAINTINNVVGLGGIISIGLRGTLFGKEVETKKITDGISKVFIFMMSGLSIYSLLALISLFVVPENHYLLKYWIWLVIGSLYFPGAVILAKVSEKTFATSFSGKLQFEIVLSSFFEWTGVMIAFLGTGYLMGAEVSLVRLIPLFIAATVIGIISMVPGELGSFDLIMIVGMTAMGHNKEEVVAWILLYRLFYYFIPFFVGVFFLLKNMGSSINERFNDIPRQLTQEVSHKILVVLLYFSGIMVVLSATIPAAFSEYPWLNHLNPLSFHFITQIPTLILGYVLLTLGRGIASRVKKAYWPTIILLIVILGYSSLKDFSWGVGIYLILLLLFVLFSKHELHREQLIYSWEMATVDGVVYGILTVLYIAIGVYNLPHVVHRRVHDFLLFPSEKVWLAGLITIIIITVFIYIFFRYLGYPKKKVGELLDSERIEKLFTTYGGDENSALVFLKDKRIYYYQNEEGQDVVAFQFQIYNNKCMIMGAPIGQKEAFKPAIETFMEEADRYGYQLLFYEVTDELITYLHEYGFDFIKMGEEAHVALADFTLQGKKNRGLRSLMNRFEREEYQFEIVQPPFNQELMSELKDISDEWLAGRKEKGFSLGFFYEEYLQRAPIALVKDKDGRIVAFANLMSTYDDRQATIDLMRYRTDAPHSVMDFLFISLFGAMKEEGYEFFNLGMAPLANVGTSRKSFIQERMAYLLFNFGSHFYSFQGLKEYKQKFATEWVQKYTLYSRDSSLVYAMLQLVIINDKTVNLVELEGKKEQKE